MLTPDKIPELGDVMVLQVLDDENPYLPAGEVHVVLISEVKGFVPDKINIIEADPEDDTIGQRSLISLIDRAN